MPPYTQDNRPMGVYCSEIPKDGILLVSFTGHEAISRLFSFQLEVIAPYSSDGISVNELVGQEVVVRMDLPAGEKRYFSGICKRASRGADVGFDFNAYRMEIVPELWKLTKKAQSRIFQQKSVPDILKEVFKGLNVEYKISGNFHPRDFCVQYRETDFNFASRLMEEEGIFYFFKHAASGHSMVVANNREGYAELPGGHKNEPKKQARQSDIKVLYEPVKGGLRKEDRIHEWEEISEWRSEKYRLRDFCFELQAKGILEAEYQRQPGPALPRFGERLEIYDYPGEYAKRFDGVDEQGVDRPSDYLGNLWPDGDRTVKIRSAEQDPDSLDWVGASNCRNLVTGHKFLLVGEPHRLESADYFLTSISHSARQSADYRSNDVEFHYGNSFSCRFADSFAPFRPARLTPHPVVHGTQTAVVVGPKGKEIHTDKYGRVKVQFHWDREGKNDENSSCWIRVAQPVAGKRWGASFWPRIGQEVIVDFLEGDPDRPIIIGSVYNADQMPPYLGKGFDRKHDNDNKVSGVKSNSTLGGKGYNEWRFDDTAGKEQIFIHAQRNMDVRVLASSMTSVGGSCHLTVGGEKDGATSGDYRQKVFKDKDTTVRGDMKTKVEGKCNLMVKGDYVHFTDKKHHSDAMDGFLFHTAAKVLIDAAQEICLTVGGSFIKLTPAGIWISGPMVYINSGGAASAEALLPCDEPTDPTTADNSRSGSKSAPE